MKMEFFSKFCAWGLLIAGLVLVGGSLYNMWNEVPWAINPQAAAFLTGLGVFGIMLGMAIFLLHYRREMLHYKEMHWNSAIRNHL